MLVDKTQSSRVSDIPQAYGLTALLGLTRRKNVARCEKGAECGKQNVRAHRAFYRSHLGDRCGKVCRTNTEVRLKPDTTSKDASERQRASHAIGASGRSRERERV